MGFESIFRNKLTRPVARPMLAGGGEQTIVWSADSSGLLTRLEALEAGLAQLRSELIARQGYTSSDLDPDPNVDATTGYELASDGGLRAYVEVSVEGRGLYEVALLGAPEVVYVAKDAKVAEAAPDTNYGTSGDLVAADEGSGSARRSWLQFDWGDYPDDLWALSPVLSVLRLYKAKTVDDEIAMALKYEDLDGDDWDESGGSGITWNTQPEIDRAISRIVNVEGTDYNYFDLTPLFYLLREAKSGEWEGEPYGLVVMAEREGEDVGVVDWKSRTGAANDDQKPQIWYWEQAEKTQLMGGSVKTAKFFGKPGGTYCLVHRMLDENNNPGRWSDPVEITLPAVGATPSAPPAAPAIEATNFSNAKRVVLTTTVPLDFAAYEVEIYCSAETKYLKTTSDRFEYNFNSGSPYRDYKVRYRFVTRSGVASGWSSYTSTFRITKELKLQRADASDGTAHILIDANGDTHLVHTSGSSSRTYDYVESQARLLLLAGGRGVGYNDLNASCGQATNDSSQSTTSTTYADRTTGSITLTPPGTGNAYYLLIGKFTLFKDGANEIKVTFKVDGTETNSEEGYSASAAAETLMIGRRVAVSAGSPHTFKLCFKSGDGGSATVYRSNIIALHLGNY